VPPQPPRGLRRWATKNRTSGVLARLAPAGDGMSQSELFQVSRIIRVTGHSIPPPRAWLANMGRSRTSIAPLLFSGLRPQALSVTRQSVEGCVRDATHRPCGQATLGPYHRPLKSKTPGRCLGVSDGGLKMFVIERNTGTLNVPKWEAVGEWSTRDMAMNIARMKFGQNNPSIRIVDRGAIAAAQALLVKK
jgi:hypothetical protein